MSQLLGTHRFERIARYNRLPPMSMAIESVLVAMSVGLFVVESFVGWWVGMSVVEMFVVGMFVVEMSVE
jgi:hypothetical protein